MQPKSSATLPEVKPYYHHFPALPSRDKILTGIIYRNTLNPYRPSMAALKTPDLIIHPLITHYDVDPQEISGCVESWCNGDCGVIGDEDEIMGFMNKSIRDRVRHGVYETWSGGRVHLVGDSKRIAIYPDLVFAQTTKVLECTVNRCDCFEKVFNSTPTPTQKTN